ncbi:MAG: chorismate synthase [Halanaerobiales bacterium]|nr:chorismate synthase [Halanaerobiales bacterium]
MKYFNIDLISHVVQIGNISITEDDYDVEYIRKRIADSKLNCIDIKKEQEMISLIDNVKSEGDSLGGVVEVVTNNIILGLGSHTSWNKRIDQKITSAMMSIPSVKGVEIGRAFQ